MPIRSLRQKHNWSQQQLAQMSGLNIRTIQRVEKGESVGLETMKSLAAVFEVDVDELQVKRKESEINNQQALNEHKEAAEAEVRGKKQFYFLSSFLILTYVLFLLPNYNQGENLEVLIYLAVCYLFIIAAHAVVVFQPFGEKWEQKQIKRTIARYQKEDEE